LADVAVVAKVNGEVWDLDRPFEGDAKLEILKFDDDEGKQVFWHSSAHIMGEAMERYCGGHLCYGPPISEGFYYDMWKEGDAITPDDFPKLEQIIKCAVKDKQPFERLVVSKEDLLEMFKYNKFKVRIIQEKVTTPTTTVYRCGPLIDLCRGPHVRHTGKVKIGRDQELFFFHPLSPGSAFWFPKGAHIYNTLCNFIRSEYRKRGFTEVISPNMYNSKLNELSGALTGLTRVRRFQQDDAHIFCRQDQIFDEIMGCIDFLKYAYSDVFGFTFKLNLSTRPEEGYLGDIETWNFAEEKLKEALDASGHSWELNPGDGAFYGPKIDITIQDALRRFHQCATIQLDFQLPQRFDLTYFEFQAKVITVHESQNDYAKMVRDKIEFDADSSDTLNKQIRNAQLAQFNFILVVGPKEAQNGTVNVRTRDNAVCFFFFLVF
uniref:Threonyl-tRNA synthetase n=1 Tax=Gongylonema pulchrum TaxID=637853 RepID=A0A183DW62_9BILA